MILCDVSTWRKRLLVRKVRIGEESSKSRLCDIFAEMPLEKKHYSIYSLPSRHRLNNRQTGLVVGMVVGRSVSFLFMDNKET